ncbi:MAG: melibiose:sodium transporter MelB [Candidatus Nanopelagicales bacterium]
MSTADKGYEPLDSAAGLDPTAEAIVPRTQQLAYGLGALGKDFGCAIVFIYTMFFMIDIAGVSAAFVGALMLVSRLFDAFTDPAMGLVVDNTRTRWGKFRPWVISGAIINSFFIVGLFTIPDGVNLELYFGAMFILWAITYTLNDIPFWSMLPTLATGKRSREKLAVIPRLFASLAWWLLGTFGLWAVARLGNGNEAQGYQMLAIIMSVLFVALSLLCVVMVRPLSEEDQSGEKTSFKRMIQIIVTNDQLIVFLISVALYNMIIQIAGGMSLFYFTDVIGNQDLFAVWRGFGGLTQMAGLIALPMVARMMSRQVLYFVASVLPVIGLTLLWVGASSGYASVPLVAAASILENIGVGFFLGISTVMLADIVDYSEFKMGTRNESVIFSIQPMLVKFAAAFASGFVGFGLAFVGHNPDLDVQSAGTKAGMTFLMIWLPIIAAVVGYLVYRAKYKLNGEFHDEVLSSLAAERLVPAADGYPL